ncbi:MAG: 50S ribosomal protein L23 [Phycisphaerae bacterium]|nr:50S ribosomal protein L23 [Phycisphaerae bacterium]
MDLYHTIIKPLITEKSSHQSRVATSRRGGAYSFEVHPEANKTQIKDAVEKIYGVTVLSVRTSNRIGKLRRYRYGFGRTRARKKAIVVLDPNSAIDLF